jgi:hypothetical protein
MARFSAPKKFIVEDYPAEYRGVLSKMFQDLNQFMTQVTSAFTQGIVFVDNMKGLKIPLNIAVNQTYPMTFNASSLKERPVSLHIGSIQTTDESAISSAFSVAWAYKDGVISYTLIGLNAAKKYTGNLIVIV